MPIHSVLGVIEPSELGLTSMHEHVFADASEVFYEPGDDPAPGGDKVCAENIGWLRWNALGLKDNLVLDDPAVAERELRHAAEAGGRTIVDLTVVGLQRRVRELPAISRASGMSITVATGFYIEKTHPDWIKDADVDQIAAFMLRELREGVDGSDLLPAMIGEIGTGHPVTDQEQKVVRAAGVAGAQSGAAVNIHLSWGGKHAPLVLDLLVGEGMSPDRVVFSHLDLQLDAGYHRELAQSGAILSFDTFGSIWSYGSPKVTDSTDQQRIEALVGLLEDGYATQLVLGCDICWKQMLRCCGGMGYEHLFRRILPALEKDYAVPRATIETMMTSTPARLLDRPASW